MINDLLRDKWSSLGIAFSSTVKLNSNPEFTIIETISICGSDWIHSCAYVSSYCPANFDFFYIHSTWQHTGCSDSFHNDIFIQRNAVSLRIPSHGHRAILSSKALYLTLSYLLFSHLILFYLVLPYLICLLISSHQHSIV